MIAAAPRRLGLVAALLSLSPPGAAQGTAPSPAAPTGRVELAERVEAVVMKRMAEPGAVGLSVAVGLGGEVAFARGFGQADLEFDVPADADTLFRIGSVTKQFTAAAIVKLHEQGKLHIDADLTEYVPEYATGKTVTLRHLLTHTGGVPSYTDLGPSWLEIVSRELTHEQMLALFKDRPLDFAPGERWRYSNSGYYLLGMIVERASGLGYGEYLSKTFFEPLGLAHTRYDSNAEIVKNRAQGYRFENGVPRNDALIGMSQPGGAGGLISTAQDLVRWQIALSSGKVVARESYEEMTMPFLLDDGHETTYGFGLALGELQGHRRIWHSGGIFGFNSILDSYPGAGTDAGLVVSVISNSEALDSNAVAADIVNALLGGAPASAPSGG